MKREKSTARWTRNLLAVGLLILAGVASVRAQMVIPTVCFESKPETFTRILTVSSGVSFGVTQTTPNGFYRVVLNPGGATEESRSFSYIFNSSGTTNLFLTVTGVSSPPLVHPHFAGETVLLTADGDAAFGYNNTSSAAVTIPGGRTMNGFNIGATVYPTQPSVFQPGRRENVVVFKAVSDTNVTWVLDGGRAKFNAAQSCATSTYQGRLSDGAAAANGQYDLQFQAFETETGGIAQSELIALENVPVTNGVFTVPLKFGSTLANNFKFKFLEIGVRPGNAPPTDPFTVLTPRQPLTQVPYAVNAIIAQTASSVSGAVRLLLTTNAPPATECDTAAEHGQMKVDAVNNRLYICTTTGWKSTVLQ